MNGPQHVLHGLLYLAPILFGLIAAKWPQWWPACIAALAFAHYVAINTHKPGADGRYGITIA